MTLVLQVADRQWTRRPAAGQENVHLRNVFSCANFQKLIQSFYQTTRVLQIS